MQKFQDVVLDSQGRPVEGAVIAVQEYPGGGAATVYETNNVGAAYVPTTDAYGAFFFYAPNGRYSYTVTVGGVLRKTVTDVEIVDTVDGFDDRPIPTQGTWTPEDGSGAGLSFTSVSGDYVKNGSLVFIQGSLEYPSTANTDISKITGLPFGQSATVTVGSMAISQSDLGSSFYLQVRGSGTGTGTWLAPLTLSGAPRLNSQNTAMLIKFSGWYLTDE